MFDKLTITFSTDLRRALAEKDLALNKTPLIQHALQAPIDLARIAMVRGNVSNLANFRTVIAPEKVIDGSHGESNDLVQNFSEASRISVYISFRTPQVLEVQIQFHKKGKTVWREWHLLVYSDGAVRLATRIH